MPSIETVETQLPSASRYRVRVDQYVAYHRDGALKVESLVSSDDIERLKTWADDLLYGREPVESLAGPEGNATIEDLLQRFTRIHMLHRTSATAEWGLLHPRVLDVLEALIGPDVLALQSMLFFNPPGKGGQGWHQDSYYITTFPDTLVGAWICLDPADEENGCLWIIPGSQNEPIYPPHHASLQVHDADSFDDLHGVEGVSNIDYESNTLTRVVKKYPPPIPVPMQPGDVLFFHGHVLHRSYVNRSAERFRRAYVTHFCNAWSFVPWNHGAPYEGDSANYQHILARGWTHLPFAEPMYGTPVHTSPRERILGDADDGMME